MGQNESEWGTWRIQRLLTILDYKAQGLTDAEVAAKMPISRNTVNRELNSPQAAEIGKKLMNKASGLLWSLTDRQVKQIESLEKPVSQVVQRGRLINTLASLIPKQVEQKITGELTKKVKMIDVTEEDLITVGFPVTLELLKREARGVDAAVPEEDPEESVG